MKEWVPRIREAAQDAREMHILMNNCYANYGSTNARELASILAAELEAEPGVGEPTAVDAATGLAARNASSD